ncbi:MAG: DUF3667 domain-containing protein [Chitinophagaceae bacterium]|nr:MAG: DUF3667 domain-containing protein [Chitinophagaceae bacterium]
MEHTCRNCGADFNGKFCNNCGQKFNVPRFSFKHILEEVFHAFTHADKSFLSFGWNLLLYPGKLSYEFIVERKRKKYFNPFTFFLLMLAISLFFEHYQLELAEKLFHSNNEYGRMFNVYGKALMLAFVPLTALVFWLLAAKRNKLLYAEFTVFSMMVTSAYLIINLFSYIIDAAVMLAFRHSFDFKDNLIYLVLVIAYIAYAHLDFQKRNGATAVAGSVFSGILYFALLFLVQVFIIWAVLRHFNGLGTFGMYGIRIGY